MYFSSSAASSRPPSPMPRSCRYSMSAFLLPKGKTLAALPHMSLVASESSSFIICCEDCTGGSLGCRKMRDGPSPRPFSHGILAIQFKIHNVCTPCAAVCAKRKPLVYNQCTGLCQFQSANRGPPVLTDSVHTSLSSITSSTYLAWPVLYAAQV